MFCVQADGAGGQCFSEACPEVPSVSPEVFGPPLWYSLHVMASNYAERPSEERRGACEAFLSSLPAMLPCRLCEQHLRTGVADAGAVAAACQTRDSLARFLCELHNGVNARSGKDTCSCDDAVQRYASAPLCRARDGGGTCGIQSCGEAAAEV